ncbi:proteasome alpha subunit [Halopolyspora algeriensis]|uniref:Proteasome subunit alpha n=1 Tax=Halopolyspora algeriensis TaxID=1500506 RepID=A0A368VJQ9_9ACTN|nr:proteasome subunit alpha [Halopolyspora algeriensis]RCW40466.1 proteasome alpha subunit [Halopolyspora algeriensis]TQM53749.1 proteasome alpha subunit [Halopolyspora algeriensis]
MTMPFYTSPEQLMRERSELARKGIARGRSVVVLKYAGGVLFVAENPSTTLHKISEIYDRIGFAAVGRYSEFENLRMAGIRMADVKGYSYDRRDVTGRALANAYAQTLGAIFTEQVKPFEVEICVGEVGSTAEFDQLYRLTYDGSIVDEPQYVVMGGQAETITTALKQSFTEGLELRDAIATAIRALSSDGESSRELGVGQLEVAVLERSRPHRTFRRISGAALRELLPGSGESGSGEQSASAPGGDESGAGGDVAQGDR